MARVGGVRTAVLVVFVATLIVPTVGVATGTGGGAVHLVERAGFEPATGSSLLPAPANATLTSGLPLCDGMYAYFHAQNPEEDAGKTYTVASTGNLGGVTGIQLTLDDDAEAIINTSRFGSGEYVLEDENGDPVVVDRAGNGVTTGNQSQAAWSITSCTLEVNFDPRSVTVEDDNDPPSATIDVRASDDDTVYVTSPRIGTDTLATLIDGGSATPRGVEVPLDGDGITLTFPHAFECFPGEYTFRVQGASSDASAPAFLRVERGPDDTRIHRDVTVDKGETGRVVLRVDRCDGPVTLRFGSATVGYEAFATFETDGEAIVAIDINTAKAERGPASAFFAAIENAEFIDRRIARDDQEAALQPNPYGLQLRVDDIVVENAEFTIERRDDGPATMSPVMTPTPFGTTAASATPPPGTPSATSRPVETISPMATAPGAGNDGGRSSVIAPGVGIVLAGAIVAYALLRAAG